MSSRLVLLALVACMLSPSPALAQEAAVDSARTVRQARSAVASHVRRLRPVTPLGRRTARDSRPRLIARLDALGDLSPRDEWIVGHRVGLRVIHGDLDDALVAARDCESTPWWCAALTGFVYHVREEFAEADSAFDVAMLRMPEKERCAWLEEIPTHLVSGDFRREFARADCSERIDLERRLWWLADPLYLVPGNDRRSEHYARMVGMRLHHELLHLDGISCSDTHHEAQIKQGWPDWWWSPEADITRIGGGPGYQFIPPPDVALEPLQSTATDWSISGGGSGERYDPPYGPVHTLDQQTAFFLRGDSVAVVATIDLEGSPLGEGPTIDRGLILASSEADPPLILNGQDTGDRQLFRVTVPVNRYLVGLEAVTPDSGVARARFGHGLPETASGRPMISDLLLWDWREGLEQELDTIAPHMIGSARIPRERSIGVYWEMYDLSPGEVVDVDLQAIPTEGGLLRRVARALRLVGPKESLQFIWTEGSADNPSRVVGRSIELDLSVLPPGDYTIELGIRTAADEAVVRREITLVDGAM